MHTKNSDPQPPNLPFPAFDPNYPLDEVDDNLHQLEHPRHATPQLSAHDRASQPVSCKEIEVPYAQRRASNFKVDVQSPADGYFEQRSHPRQTFVENDPTSKAKEAEIESERSREANSGGEMRSERQQQSRWTDDSTPMLLDAGPAPPDYEAATADRRAQQEQQSFRSDHPLVRNGLLGEHGVFNSRGQQPESMTQPQSSRPTEVPAAEGNYRDAIEAEEQPDETRALLNRPGRGRSKKQRSWFSRCMKSCCMLFGVLLLVIVAIIATQATLKPHNDYDTGDGQGSQGRYRKAPENDPTPPHPSHSHGCSLDSFSRTRWIGFESISKDFEFLELIDSTSYRHLFPAGARIGGTIRISPALQDQEQDVKVWVNIATSRPVSIEDLNFDIKENFLEVVFPDVDVGRGGDMNRKQICFDIAVAIHVKKGTRVRNWKTNTAHLGVVVDEGVFGMEEKGVDMFDRGLTVENSTEIFAVSGDVDVAYWSSRRTIVETLSGDIEGTFALRDLLVLSSKSGHIDAEVEPKKADEEKAVPAEFIMKSLSGYVNAEFPTNREEDDQEAIPDRDYKVRVETKSGDISGTYILGQSAKFSALSGDLNLGIMPYSANLSNSHLQTDVVSGTTRVQVFEPYHADSFDHPLQGYREHREGVIDALQSHHKSLSGEMELKYPQEWEGKIDGKTVSGNINLRGKDVEVWVDSEVPELGRRVVAHKGTGHSSLKFETTSGDVDVLVGEELVFSRKIFEGAFVG